MLFKGTLKAFCPNQSMGSFQVKNMDQYTRVDETNNILSADLHHNIVQLYTGNQSVQIFLLQSLIQKNTILFMQYNTFT